MGNYVCLVNPSGGELQALMISNIYWPESWVQLLIYKSAMTTFKIRNYNYEIVNAHANITVILLQKM